ncbi:MAG: tryptophanase [Acidobacteriota bacterium]|nr:tryptophanase [Acidobacteriota bacterium]
MKTIIEPFRIKAVEPIRLASPEQREEVLRDAGFNLFKIAAEHVLIDLLTDSGTGAMSAQQWAAVMRADESYAGSTSFLRLRETVEEIMGFERMLPTHQGRASERILFDLIGGEGRIVPNNAHFDTTRANIEHSGAQAVDLGIPEATDPTNRHPFKGNLDLDRLESLLAAESSRVPVVMCTVTSNTSGGQPVSLENLRSTRDLCRRHGVPLFLDACRFAENAWFIKQREAGQQDRSARDIAREMFDLADGATISAKKDGIVNIGGLLLLRDEELFRRASDLTILTEGYVTYGGLAGRDLEAMAQGFREVLDEDYLRYRIRSTTYVGEKLLEAGIQIVEPPGGHAIYIDACRFCRHLSREQLPGQALVVALYRHAGIRTCEVGTVMFGARQQPALDLVRLAVPRRVYTQSHMDYVVEALVELYAKRERIRGLRIVDAPAALPHFSARFEEVQESAR